MKRKIKNSSNPLQATIHLALGWFFIQGLIYVLAFDGLAQLLRLRWDSNSIPLLKSNGVLLIALSFYLSRALDKPDRQLLVVDTLLVMMLGQGVITMSSVQSGIHSMWDWFTLSIYIGLGVSLMIHRVKEKDLPLETAAQKEEAETLPPPPQLAPQAVFALSHQPDQDVPMPQSAEDEVKILNSLAWLQSHANAKGAPGHKGVAQAIAPPTWVRKNLPAELKPKFEIEKKKEEGVDLSEVLKLAPALGMVSGLFKKVSGKPQKKGPKKSALELLKPPENQSPPLYVNSVRSGIPQVNRRRELREANPPPIAPPLPAMALSESPGQVRRSEALPALE